MNPERRFGQIEEVLAEVLQKQDRLESLGTMTFEVATNADAKADALIMKTDSLDAKVDGLDTKVDGLDAKVDGLDAKVDGVDARVGSIDVKAETTARALANLTVENQQAHQAINNRLDGIDDRLSDIMSFLKEKLG